MNKTILDHYNVFDELNNYFNDNKVALSVFPLIVEIFTLIESNRQILLALFEQQKQKGQGIAADKKALKLFLINQILLSIGTATGFYYNAGNMTLYNELNFPYSELLRKRPADLIQASNGIVKTLKLNIADLTGTGVTIDSIKSISDATSDYSLIINSPNMFVKS